jgi:hypothetical protein
VNQNNRRNSRSAGRKTQFAADTRGDPRLCTRKKLLVRQGRGFESMNFNSCSVHTRNLERGSRHAARHHVVRWGRWWNEMVVAQTSSLETTPRTRMGAWKDRLSLSLLMYFIKIKSGRQIIIQSGVPDVFLSLIEAEDRETTNDLNLRDFGSEFACQKNSAKLN